MVSIGLRYKLNINKQIQCNLINGWVHEDKIVNHSKNPINLVEYGDLIKFKGLVKVTDIRTDEEIELLFGQAEFCDGWYEDKIIYDLNYLIKKDQSNKIDWVVTHEQINQNCFKVVE